MFGQWRCRIEEWVLATLNCIQLNLQKYCGNEWGFLGDIYPWDVVTACLKYCLKLFRNSALKKKKEKKFSTKSSLKTVHNGWIKCMKLSFPNLACVQLLSSVQLFGTPWTIARQSPLLMGFPRQEYWNGLPFPSPGDLPDPEIKPVSLVLSGWFFTTEPPGKPFPKL